MSISYGVNEIKDNKNISCPIACDEAVKILVSDSLGLNVTGWLCASDSLAIK